MSGLESFETEALISSSKFSSEITNKPAGLIGLLSTKLQAENAVERVSRDLGSHRSL